MFGIWCFVVVFAVPNPKRRLPLYPVAAVQNLAGIPGTLMNAPASWTVLDCGDGVFEVILALAKKKGIKPANLTLGLPSLRLGD